MSIKLCYGLLFDTSNLSKNLGIEEFVMKHKKCPFCALRTEKMALDAAIGRESFNFCPNCGTSLVREIEDVEEREVIEVILRNVPSELWKRNNINLLSLPGKVVICHVLSSGVDFAMFDRPVQHFSWEPMEKAIKAILQNLGIEPEMEFRMFCLAEKGQ